MKRYFKKALGYLLVSTPFIAMYIVALVQDGLTDFLLSLLIVACVLLVVGVGVKLIVDNE